MHAEKRQTATPTNTLTHFQMDSFFVDLSTAFCSYFISKADILNPKRLIANDDYICIYDVLCIWLFVLSNKCFRLLKSD